MSAHYDFALQEHWKGTLGDLTSAAVIVKCRLLRKSAYTPAQTHQYLTALPAPIVADQTLTGKTANGQGASPGCFDAADLVFPNVPAGPDIDSLAVYKDTGNPATSPLLFYMDGFVSQATGGNITLAWQNTPPFIAKL